MMLMLKKLHYRDEAAVEMFLKIFDKKYTGIKISI
jgi:hypothetical protein